MSSETSRSQPPAQKAPTGQGGGQATRPVKRKARDLILDALLELLLEKGLDGTTIDEVIARSGVARGTFYYNFSGKCAAVQELARREFRPLARGTEQLFEERASLAGALDFMARGMVRWYVKYPRLGEALIRCSHSEEGRALPPDPDNKASFRGFLTALLARGQEAGQISTAIPPLSLAMMFTGLIFQGLFLWYSQPGTVDLEDWAGQAVDLFLNGVALDGSPKAGGEA